VLLLSADVLELRYWHDDVVDHNVSSSLNWFRIWNYNGSNCIRTTKRLLTYARWYLRNKKSNPTHQLVESYLNKSDNILSLFTYHFLTLIIKERCASQIECEFKISFHKTVMEPKLADCYKSGCLRELAQLCFFVLFKNHLDVEIT
jgi:hypothetical protein